MEINVNVSPLVRVLTLTTDHERPLSRPLSTSHQGVDEHVHITKPVSPQQDEIASL